MNETERSGWKKKVFAVGLRLLDSVRLPLGQQTSWHTSRMNDQEFWESGQDRPVRHTLERGEKETGTG